MHGHVVGDAVLVELARRLTRRPRPSDCLARWGGEEFAVLLQGVGSDAELDRLAERLRSTVARTPVVADGRERAADDLDRRRRARATGLATSRRFGRGSRPLPVCRQAPRPRPRLAGPGPGRGRPAVDESEAVADGTSAGGHRRVARGRDRGPRRAGGFAGRRGRPSRWPWGPVSPSAALWAAGSTTSARWRSPSESCASPARSTPMSGRSCGPIRPSARTSCAAWRRCARRPPRCATTTSASTAAATRIAWRAPRSRSRRGSSPPPTRMPR